MGLLKLLEVLNRLAIRYMLVGSYSSNFYGIPRSTKDADLEVWFPTAEDVIVQKVRWAKSGGRGKDFDDVVAILKVQTTLDFEHINHWCSRHETLEILEKALLEAGRP